MLAKVLRRSDVGDWTARTFARIEEDETPWKKGKEGVGEGVRYDN